MNTRRNMNKIYIFKTNAQKGELSKTAYSLLDKLLLENYGIAMPTILKTAKGKPYLKDHDVYFNISHTNGAIAIAFSESETGVDIEHVRPTDTKIANRFFCESEAAFLEKVENKNAEFLKMWTRKEAYIKMTGEGISAGLNTFDTLEEKIAKKIKTFEIEGFYISVCSKNTDDFETIITTI